MNNCTRKTKKFPEKAISIPRKDRLRLLFEGYSLVLERVKKCKESEMFSATARQSQPWGTSVLEKNHMFFVCKAAWLDEDFGS